MVDRDSYVCITCGHEWKTRKDLGEPPYCPRCRGREIINESAQARKKKLEREKDIDTLVQLLLGGFLVLVIVELIYSYVILPLYNFLQDNLIIIVTLILLLLAISWLHRHRGSRIHEYFGEIKKRLKDFRGLDWINRALDDKKSKEDDR